MGNQKSPDPMLDCEPSHSGGEPASIRPHSWKELNSGRVRALGLGSVAPQVAALNGEDTASQDTAAAPRGGNGWSEAAVVSAQRLRTKG